MPSVLTASYDAVRAGIELVYCLIAPPDGIGCCGQVYRVDHALMAQHGELIEISPDAFQLMKDWFEFLYLVDRLAECRDAKVFAVSHASLGGDLFDCFPFAVCHPKGLFSVSFAITSRVTLFGQSLSPLFLCKSGFGLPPEKIMRLAPAAYGGGSPNALLAR